MKNDLRMVKIKKKNSQITIRKNARKIKTNLTYNDNPPKTKKILNVCSTR